MTVHVLIATIPARQAFCARLLVELSKQSLQPESIHLVLDGYGNATRSAVDDALRLSYAWKFEYQTNTCSGPGGRWRVLKEICRQGPSEDNILVNFDDDQQLLATDVLHTLVKSVEHGGAASHMGTTLNGFGMAFPAGTPLLAMGAATMALHVTDLDGLGDTLDEIRSKCDFDPFGDGGDDEAVIAAHLWRRGIPMRATGPLAIRTAPGTQEGSQTERRQALRGGRSRNWQREAIARVTGWPWVSIG